MKFVGCKLKVETQEWKQGIHFIEPGKDDDDNNRDRNIPVDAEDILKVESIDFADVSDEGKYQLVQGMDHGDILKQWFPSKAPMLSSTSNMCRFGVFRTVDDGDMRYFLFL